MGSGGVTHIQLLQIHAKSGISASKNHETECEIPQKSIKIEAKT
jgi:hypothetical protein